MRRLYLWITVISTPLLLAGVSLLASDRKSEIPESNRSTTEHTNHLIDEKSPYLLQHAHNPVDWYPWGDEALQRAKSENKPIFLSIGYASCHWCHVMERESFENEEIAALLNHNFISIKVDREERPDLDHIYMTATTIMTGSGGWPMSVFLTPALKPFYAGTYFPPEDRYGRPGLKTLISELADIYRNEPAKISAVAQQILVRLSMVGLTYPSDSALPNADLLATAGKQLLQNYDPTYGGFGNSRKFPQASQLNFLSRLFDATKDSSYWISVNQTLKAMRQGGIFDHLAGGFHRYTVDRQWQVPHFEKMLYDNAQLAILYANAYQISGDSTYLETVRRTLDFMLAELSGKHGEFFSAIDADSEGEEGKFYVWSYDEIVRILGNRSQPFIRRFGISRNGNFEGHNILHLPFDMNRKFPRILPDSVDFFEGCRKDLLSERSKRIRPLTDDKALTSWNGLALAALCRGYQITGDRRYLEAAKHNADFVQSTMYEDGYLLHSYRNDRKGGQHFLEDYAYYLSGLLQLIQSDPVQNDRWLSFATDLADTTISLFGDDMGNLYLREADASGLIVRPKDVHDGATPAPGSVFIDALLKLHRLTDKNTYLAEAEKALKALSGEMARVSSAMTTAILAADYYYSDKVEIVVVGTKDASYSMLHLAWQRYLPNAIVIASEQGKNSSPLFEGRIDPNGNLLAYVCVNSACLLPATSLDELRQQLTDL